MVGFGIAFALSVIFGAMASAPAKANADTGSKPVAATDANNPLAAATVGTIPSSSTAPTASAAEVVTKPKPFVTLSARIDLTSQTVAISERGKLLYTWKISSGTRDFQTPTGTFRPQWMAKMWFSKKYDDAPMPHSVFFKDGVALHATQATHALGRPASHGCVRLAPANAATFYGLVQKHGMAQTQIQVFGAPKFAPVAKTAPEFDAGGAYAAAQRLRASRTASGYGYYLPPPAPVTSPGSIFGASPYRYPGDPLPARRNYGYGVR